jgi:hypothetical protein
MGRNLCEVRIEEVNLYWVFPIPKLAKHILPIWHPLALNRGSLPLSSLVFVAIFHYVQGVNHTKPHFLTLKKSHGRTPKKTETEKGHFTAPAQHEDAPFDNEPPARQC